MGGSGGFVMPDRVDLPFVTIPDPRSTTTPPARISALRIDPDGEFAERSWGPDWAAWHVLVDFAGTTDWRADTEVKDWEDWPTPPAISGNTDVDGEIDDLVKAAINERADALGEILAQDTEFLTDFLALLAITPRSHPWTYRVMHIAYLIGLFVAMHYKEEQKRRRPSQVCPALRPPVPVPGHASYPSGHATQAHLIALCLSECIKQGMSDQTAAGDLGAALTALAERIARNREIGGLHYKSDSEAGKKLAADTFAFLNGAKMPKHGTPAQSRFAYAIGKAKLEWA